MFFAEYFAACKFLAVSFGRTRLVDDLAAHDFQALRAKLAKLYGVHKLAKEFQLTRKIFKYGVDAGLIDEPVRFPPLSAHWIEHWFSEPGVADSSAAGRSWAYDGGLTPVPWRPFLPPRPVHDFKRASGVRSAAAGRLKPSQRAKLGISAGVRPLFLP